MTHTLTATSLIGLASILFVLFFIIVGCLQAYKLLGEKRDLIISFLISLFFFADLFFLISYF